MQPKFQGFFENFLDRVGLNALQLPFQRGAFQGGGQLGADAGTDRHAADAGQRG